MLLLLILGRWMLPKGSITRNELSQLLFIYFGMAFDIMELFYLYEEQAVLARPDVQYVILIIWSISLFQFVIVLTVVKNRRTRLSMERHGGQVLIHKMTRCKCCHSEVWSLLTNVLMQDLPFLILRLYCLIGLDIFSYNLLFYTVKNILIVLLQTYRLVILVLSCTRPGFDERRPRRAPSVEILGTTFNSSTTAASNHKLLTASDFSTQNSTLSGSNFQRTNSQDFNFVSNV